MDSETFVGEVHRRLELSSADEAAHVSRAVLTTLGERLQPGEAADLAAQLPSEIGRIVEGADSGQRFGFDEFVDRTCERGDVDRSDTVYRAQVVFALLSEAVTGGEMQDVRDQLPSGYHALYEIAGEPPR